MIPEEIKRKLLIHRKTRYIPIGFQSDLMKAIEELMEEEGYVLTKRNSKGLPES